MALPGDTLWHCLGDTSHTSPLLSCPPAPCARGSPSQGAAVAGRDAPRAVPGGFQLLTGSASAKAWDCAGQGWAELGLPPNPPCNATTTRAAASERSQLLSRHLPAIPVTCQQSQSVPRHLPAIPPLPTAAPARAQSCLQLYLFHILLPQLSLTDFSWKFLIFPMSSPPRQGTRDVRHPHAGCRAGKPLKPLSKSKVDFPLWLPWHLALSFHFFYRVSITSIKTQSEAKAFTVLGGFNQYGVIKLKGFFVQLCR